MTYAKVINNEIVEYNRTLPFSTETTSFGVGTTTETLKEFGYLPVIGSEPEYDRALQRIGNVSYVISNNEVTKVYEVVELTADEIRERDVPKVLTPRQARLVLLQNGLLDDVEAALATNREYQIYWEYSLDIKRDDVLLNQIASDLAISNEQLDIMFIQGAKL